MKTAFFIAASVLGFSQAFAAVPVQSQESYVKSTCYAVPYTGTNYTTPPSAPMTPFATYYFYIEASQPYPRMDELTQLYGSRYIEFLKVCTTNDYTSSPHRATTEYVSVSAIGLRAVGAPCRTHSQCQSGACDLLKGSCN